jgi:hypothetical protein
VRVDVDGVLVGVGPGGDEFGSRRRAGHTGDRRRPRPRRRRPSPPRPPAGCRRPARSSTRFGMSPGGRAVRPGFAVGPPGGLPRPGCAPAGPPAGRP